MKKKPRRFKNPPSLRSILLTREGIFGLSCAFLVLCYSLWVLNFNYRISTEQKFSSGLAIFLSFAFALLAFHVHRVKTAKQLSIGRGWLYLGLAGVVNGAGELVWSYYENVLQIAPFVSPADIFFICYYPLVLAGLLSFPFGPVKREERIVLWLDLAIVTTTGFMLLWYFILLTSAQYGLKTLVAVYYPGGGLLILAALVALTERNIESMDFWTLFLLGCGMVCNIIADSFFAYFEIADLPYNVVHINILYLLAFLFLIQAAVWYVLANPAPQEIKLPETGSAVSPRLLRLALPYIATFIGMVLLVLVVGNSETTRTELRGVLWGALTLVALVLLRQYVVLRENVGLYRQMERLAITDPLTGIYNRRFANQRLETEMERAVRYEHPLAILIMDIDGFKNYNDTHGHLAGDLLLKEVTHKIGQSLRVTDFLARLGGDEFLAILAETDISGAIVVAAKVKRSLQPVKGIGLSVGISLLLPGMTPQELLEAADKALYQDKNQARDPGKLKN